VLLPRLAESGFRSDSSVSKRAATAARIANNVPVRAAESPHPNARSISEQALVRQLIWLLLAAFANTLLATHSTHTHQHFDQRGPMKPNGLESHRSSRSTPTRL
jgi:hypothetical protein